MVKIYNQLESNIKRRSSAANMSPWGVTFYEYWIRVCIETTDADDDAFSFTLPCISE